MPVALATEYKQKRLKSFDLRRLTFWVAGAGLEPTYVRDPTSPQIA